MLDFLAGFFPSHCGSLLNGSNFAISFAGLEGSVKVTTIVQLAPCASLWLRVLHVEEGMMVKSPETLILSTCTALSPGLDTVTI